MISAGVRAAFVASQFAAERMVHARRGLIVHISSWAAQKYIGNVIYGVAKAATDKIAADMAHELALHGVTVVSLYPGLVRTEAVVAAGVFDLRNSGARNSRARSGRPGHRRELPALDRPGRRRGVAGARIWLYRHRRGAARAAYAG